ncbi:uncharacterized protein LOC108740736 [Agrilus planipennis]|uniref:Uncharacterized protein LOC108740736 n=1 Tax=Agrilus planipennis TaxID=224129 RepID=A0A1W4XE08_AGRPL|nr:uncharacterized protein LOC108740736 [Agrilus planipennis]
MMHDYFHIDLSPTYSNRFFESATPKFSEKSKSTTSVKQFSTTSSFPNKKQVTRNCSFVVGQKLRESKWFTHEEVRIFSAVVETGFIVQTKNEKAQITWGIAAWTPGYEKSKNPEYVSIYFLVEHKGSYKVTSKSLLNFWQPGSVIKINNYNDKEEKTNCEETIRNKISYAMKNKLKWHNTEHFVYWCRYLQPKNDRTKPASDDLKWFSSKVNMGLLLLRGKRNKSASE